MSLMKFLSTSTTFGEAKDGPTDFKLQQEFLPKFAPARRPISLAPRRSEDEPLATATTARMKGGERIELTTPAQAEKSLAARPGLVTRFFEWVTGMTGKSRRKAGPFVQTEWRLEQVKVVRNDLSDTDFIVRSASEPRKPGEPSVKGKTFKPFAWADRAKPVE
jgi:hypothetical protein